MHDYVILEIKQLALAYNGHVVLTDINLTIAKGKIYALVGENGAGKSSIFKSILGMVSPSSGEIFFCNESITNLGVRAVLNRGISMIHQELMLFPELSIAENLFIGREKELDISSQKKANKRAKEHFDQFGIEVDVEKPLKSLSIAQQQLVEIMRAIIQNAQLILMDEPTSSLSEKEVGIFHELIQKLKERGVTIVFTSHKMEEVLSFSDQIVVLRDGQVVAEYVSDQVTASELVEKMVGRELNDFYPKMASNPGATLLALSDLTVDGQFSSVNLEIKSGEILGLAGIVGAGRTEIAHSIMGMTKLNRGTMHWKGESYTPQQPYDAHRAGIVYLGEDRKVDGIVPEMSVRENMTAGILAKFSKLNWIQTAKEKSSTDEMRNALEIKSTSNEQAIHQLSGGNQQKVLFSRLMLHNPSLLILDEPTRGIDVYSKFELYKLILSFKKEGKGILLISSELPELLALSDRVVVMSKGMQKTSLTKSEATPEVVMNYALHG